MRSLARCTRILLASAAVAFVAIACRGHDAASRAELMRSLDEIRARPRATVPALDALHATRIGRPERFATPPQDEELATLSDALAHLDDGSRFDAVMTTARTPRVLRTGCLHAEAAGRPEHAVNACGRLLDEGHLPALAPAFFAAMWKARDLVIGVDARVQESADAWLATCRASGGACAALATELSQARARIAVRSDDEALLSDALVDGGVLSRARLEGPLAGDAPLALARAERGEHVPLRRHRAIDRERVTRDGVFVPAAYGEGGVYRLTFGLRGAGDVELHVRADDAYVLRVDGVLIAARALGAHGAPRLARHGVNLTRGDHVVELTAFTQSAGDEIALGALRDDGTPLVASEELVSRGAGARPRVLTSIVPPIPSATTLDAEAIALAVLALGRSHLFIDEQAQLDAEQRLTRDLVFHPSAFLAVAWALRADPTLPSAFAWALATPLLSLVEERAPAHPEHAVLVADSTANEHPEDALRAIERSLVRSPSSRVLHRARIPLALELGALDAARASVSVLIDAPIAPIDLDLGARFALDAGDIVLAARLERARGERDDASFTVARANALLAVGARTDALAELRHVVDVDPMSLGKYPLLDLLELDEPEEAMVLLRRHLEAFPLDRALWRRLVVLTRAVAGDDEARATLADAIARLGVDRSLVHLTEELTGAAPFAPLVERADRSARAAASTPLAPSGHPITLVLDAHERILADDGSSILVRAFVAQIESKDGKDALGEISVNAGEELLRLRVHKPDGQLLEPDFHDGVADASLAGLAVGDVVELVAVSFVEWVPLESMSYETRVLQTVVPTRERSYTLDVPKSVVDSGHFSVFARHGAPAATIEETARGRRYHFVARDIEPVPFEEFAVSDEESLPLVGFVLAIDDAAWAGLWRNRTIRLLGTSAWLAEVAWHIVGKGPSSERLARLDRFVATAIEPGGETDPIEILVGGRGDRLALLAALARAVELEVHPVAVHVPALADPEVPTTAWATFGLRIIDEEGEHYVVGDERLGQLDALAPVLDGARILDLRTARARDGFLPFLDDEDPLTSDLPDAVIDRRAPRVRVSLEPDANARALSGVVLTEVPRAHAGPLRRALKRASEDERRALFESILSANLTPLTVTETSLPDVENVGGDLTIGTLVTIPIDATNAMRRVERLFPDGATTPLGLFPPLSRPLRHVERVRPTRFLSAREELVVEVRLPDGATFSEVPEGRRATAGPVALVTEVAVTDGLLRLERTITIERARIAPSSWPALRAQLARLVSLADAQVAFVWPRAERSSSL